MLAIHQQTVHEFPIVWLIVVWYVGTVLGSGITIALLLHQTGGRHTVKCSLVSTCEHIAFRISLFFISLFESADWRERALHHRHIDSNVIRVAINRIELDRRWTENDYPWHLDVIDSFVGRIDAMSESQTDSVGDYVHCVSIHH